jgi:carbon monoxide dehydrogenase subunit G
MEISGHYMLYAPREHVWEALLDPDLLRRTVPGCERLEREEADLYRVRVAINVAAVKGTYAGTLRLSDQRRPESYHLQVEGSGARGVLRGQGEVRLEATDATTTTLHYSGQAQLGGTIASVGSRVAEGAAHLLLKQYFARLSDLLATGATPATAAAEAVSAPATAGGGIPSGQTDARQAIASNGHQPGSPVALAQRGPVTQIVHRAGLSDGNIESERRIARLMLGGVVGLAALTTAGIVLALGLSGRRRNLLGD